MAGARQGLGQEPPPAAARLRWPVWLIAATPMRLATHRQFKNRECICKYVKPPCGVGRL